ncbi:MAG: elongation factor P [Chloroflexi bacterium]|nr:elongation factor P [Chloroflexota bacterium]
MITPGELRKGIAIEIDDQLWGVVEYEHIKMGRGGALVRLKIRNLRSGSLTERTFSASERFRRVFLDRRKVQFLYADDDMYHFMDVENFEQLALPADRIGEDKNYLTENLVVDLSMYNDEPLTLDLPVTVDLRIDYTEPGFKGDTATGGNKPATLETGVRINVPLFVETGDVVRVDTRTGQYLERVKQ